MQGKTQFLSFQKAQYHLSSLSHFHVFIPSPPFFPLQLQSSCTRGGGGHKAPLIFLYFQEFWRGPLRNSRAILYGISDINISRFLDQHNLTYQRFSYVAFEAVPSNSLVSVHVEKQEISFPNPKAFRITLANRAMFTPLAIETGKFCLLVFVVRMQSDY